MLAKQNNAKKSASTIGKRLYGRRYATMAHDEASKNYQGGLSDNTVSFEKLGRMYQTEHPSDGYNSLRLYLEKLNPGCSAFFQYPKRSWKRPQEGVWFESRCLGVNKLRDMMIILSKAVNLSKIYTNHSVRATAITLWSDAGLSNRHIMSLSGHRNENSLRSREKRAARGLRRHFSPPPQTFRGSLRNTHAESLLAGYLRSYNTRPSSQQLQLCSNVLSNALNSADQHLLPQKVTQQPDLTSGIATYTISTLYLLSP